MIRAGAGQEQGRSRAEQSKAEQGRKRAGTGQELGRSWDRSLQGAGQEYGRGRAEAGAGKEQIERLRR